LLAKYAATKVDHATLCGYRSQKLRFRINATSHNQLFLFKITNAAITPGTQPIPVRINVIRTEPHPLSYTANGGNIIANNTLKNDISIDFELREFLKIPGFN
jgi:hypothetical protein